MSLGRNLADLTRSHVVRVAAGYAVVAWVIVQIANEVFPPLRLPEWSSTLVVVLSLLGFPLAIVLAWASRPVVPLAPARAPAAGEASAPDAARLGPAAGDVAPKRRLAVLPLVSFSPDRGDEYFVDGMTEELISVLSRIGGLDVIARTSVMRYKTESRSIVEISEELNVGTVLEGSVRKAGDKLRITVQLIDARTQAHLWAEDYDREMGDVFALQSDIARQVAGALELRLLAGEARRIEAGPTSNLQAYESYLLGRHFLNKRTDEGIRRSIQHLERAIALDPAYAAAHSGLADAYVLAGVGYSNLPPRDAFARARGYARRALELDETVPEAHTSSGMIALYNDWDPETAERAFLRAIELNPSHAQAHQWLAQAYLQRRQFRRQLAAIRRARELDPMSIVIATELGWAYSYMADHDSAMEQYRRALAMDPDFPLARYNLGWSYEMKGLYREAVREYRRAAELSGRGPFVLCFLARALAHLGATDEAEAIRSELGERARQTVGLCLYAAVACEGVGRTDEALDWLEAGYAAREPFLIVLDTEWLPFAQLRDHPRYRALLEKIGIPRWREPSVGRPLAPLADLMEEMDTDRAER